MNLTEYFAYLEAMATNHTQVLHSASNKRFFRTDVEELDNAIKTRMNRDTVVVGAQNPELTTQARTQSNTRLQYRGSVLIMKHVKDSGNFSERLQAEDLCRSIAIDFITRMMEDRKSYDAGNKAFALPGIDLDAFTLALIPRRYKSFAGILLGFAFNEPLPLYNANNWNG